MLLAEGKEMLGRCLGRLTGTGYGTVTLWGLLSQSLTWEQKL